MLQIKCPICGVEGDETDFHYGGEAHIKRPASDRPDRISDGEQRDYLFMRKNERGPHHERWRCDRGCGKWFNAVRDTLTMEFLATYGIREEPPTSVMAAPPPPTPRHTGEGSERISNPPPGGEGGRAQRGRVGGERE